VVFWGAFEQAGGLMNIYTMEKINRDFMGMEIPASVFQSVNAFFIIVFGTAIAGLWAKRQLNGKESSTLFKMAMGTMIMGLGFLLMSGAAMEADSAENGKAAMIWLIGAYLLHTIGELCASPNALSFVTKLAPAKYASIMMGCYFAATGFGSKLAGAVGEASQVEPIEISCIASEEDLSTYVSDSTFIKKEAFTLKTSLTKENSELVMNSIDDGKNIASFFEIPDKSQDLIAEGMNSMEGISDFHGTFKLEFDKETGELGGNFFVDEVQNERELKTFAAIFLFTMLFGILLLVFLKKLKALTHGAEDIVDTTHEEAEGFELADKQE
jgi:proton-dependent oligopeptide transporter, POT family